MGTLTNRTPLIWHKLRHSLGQRYFSESICPANQTACDDGTCLASEWFCDDYPDCADNSDELSCCPDTQFNCANGRCIEWDQWCDTNNDCRDNSDEDCIGMYWNWMFEIWRPRAVASLTFPGGQEFNSPRSFLKFQHFFLIFLNFFVIFFLILALRVGDSPNRKGPGYATVETLLNCSSYNSWLLI